MGLTFGSAFTGIGGLDLGLERSGLVCCWQIENNPLCIQVLDKQWPTVEKYTDIREVDFGKIKSVDVVCGGFPCQPVSEAGRKLAEQDERWLWPELVRAVRSIRPRYLIVENVPGLLVRGMGTVLRDLAELGYDAEWQVLPAAAFGAPHIRKRVFIVAYPASVGCNSRQVFNRADVQGFVETARRWWSGRYTNGRSGRIWRVPEFEFLRVGDGVSSRVDRRFALYGNAVVPQVAEFIGRSVINHYKAEKRGCKQNE